jgi:hypothetical protein
MRRKTTAMDVADAIGTVIALAFCVLGAISLVAGVTFEVMDYIEKHAGPDMARGLTVLTVSICILMLIVMLPAILTDALNFADNVFFCGLVPTINQLGEKLFWTERDIYTVPDGYNGLESKGKSVPIVPIVKTHKTSTKHFLGGGLVAGERQKPPRATFFCRRGEEYLTISGKYEEKWLNTWELRAWQTQKDRTEAIKAGLVDETPQTNPEPLEFTAK